MLARFAWLCPLLLASCVRDDPDHCANQDGDGDMYCAEQYDRAFCSKCRAEFDGCVGDLTKIPTMCRPDNVTTAADDGSTNDPSATPTTDTIADDSATETSAEGSSSETTGTPPVCGNELIEDYELCDTSVEDDCQAFMHGDDMVICDPESCQYDFGECSAPASICGDGVINTMDEDCDIDDFDQQTCDMQPGKGPMGDLVCTPMCEIDDSDCCLEDSEPCEAASECCSKICDGLILGKGTCGLLD